MGEGLVVEVACRGGEDGEEGKTLLQEGVRDVAKGGLKVELGCDGVRPW